MKALAETVSILWTTKRKKGIRKVDKEEERKRENPDTEGKRERGKEGKRERGKEGKRERGKEGKRMKILCAAVMHGAFPEPSSRDFGGIIKRVQFFFLADKTQHGSARCKEEDDDEDEIR